MIQYVAKKILNVMLLTIMMLMGIFLLTACQTYTQLSIDEKLVPAAKSILKAEKHDYRESTLFFDKHRASLSMLATLAEGKENLVRGYQFQFRSRRDLPVKISNIVVTVGGKRITLESGVLYLPKSKPLILELSAVDSRYIQGQPQAVFLFEYEGDTRIVLIKHHQLVAFIGSQ